MEIRYFELLPCSSSSNINKLRWEITTNAGNTVKIILATREFARCYAMDELRKWIFAVRQCSTRMSENETASKQLQWVTWNRDNFQVFEVDNFFHLFRQEFMRRLFLLFLVAFFFSCHLLLGHSFSPLLNLFYCYFSRCFFLLSCQWVRNVATKCFLFYALLAFSSISTIIRSWSPSFIFLPRSLYVRLYFSFLPL